MKKEKLLYALLVCAFTAISVQAESGVTVPTKTSDITINYSISNHSDLNGGAINNTVGGTVNIEDNQSYTTNSSTAQTSGGGAIYSHNQGTINIGNNVSFIDNYINQPNPNHEDPNNYSAGGAIAAWGASSVTIGENSNFTHNGYNSNPDITAGLTGGAIYMDTDWTKQAELNIGDGANFVNNQAGKAGALYLGDTKAVIGDVVFSGNKTTYSSGGAIYTFGGDSTLGTLATFDKASVQNNVSAYNGGGAAIYFKSDVTFGDGSDFTENRASENGGAIYMAGYADDSGEILGTKVTANSTTFEANTAKNGGAVYNTTDYIYKSDLTTEEKQELSAFTSNNSNFINNKATDKGGAIYNEAKATISNATFSGNQAAQGGAVYNALGGALSMENVTFNASSNGAKNDIYNAGAITTNGINTFSSDISGNGTFTNSGNNTFAGNNSGYTGTYSHSSESAVTTITGTFFSGDSNVFDKGTLNWETQEDFAGKLTVSGGNLNIGDSRSAVLTLREGSSIAEAVTTTLNNGSTLNIAGGEATLNVGDSWEGKIILGTAGVQNDTSSLTVGLSSGANIGKLEAENGTLNILNGLNLNLGEGSYIKNSVALITNGNINVTNGGELAIDDNDTLNGGAKITLTNGGTLNYGKTTDSSTIIEANGGNLNLLANSHLTLTSGSQIADAVTLNIQKDSTLTLDNNLTLNLDNQDSWNGKIINRNGIINTNGVTKSSNTASLIQNNGTLNIYNDSTITLDSSSTIEGGQINITKGAAGSEGSVLTVVNANITGGDMTIDESSSFIVKSGTFKLDSLTSSNLVNVMNNEINQSHIGTLIVEGQADFNIDIHARSNNYRSNDQFVVTNPVAGNGVVNINDWSLQGDIYGWDAPIDRRIVLDHIFVDENGNPLEGVIEATDKETFTPVGWYELKRNAISGVNYSLDLVKFNPQVFRGQVATVAQWMNQLAIDDMLFTHSMILPSFKEENGKMANNYAAINPLFAPYQYSIKDGGLWYKMYGTFEHLQMNNNLRVGNNSYGALIGADFGMKDIKNGWKFMPTAYIGYNGAHQYWSGMGQYQNGGQAGLMGTWYKDNFIIGGLIYGGVYENSMDVHGTTDNTFNYFAGASAKASYNIRLHRDWVLQPNLMASYNYFGQQNWHSDFGQMGMMAGMLHGVNIAPGVNLIWEKETFSAYATLQYMYNINGACGGRAGNVGLPQVEMERGYIQYGLGFTKKFTDRASGYLQAVLRNVGRTGVGFQAGFNIKLGK